MQRHNVDSYFISSVKIGRHSGSAVSDCRLSVRKSPVRVLVCMFSQLSVWFSSSSGTRFLPQSTKHVCLGQSLTPADTSRPQWHHWVQSMHDNGWMDAQFWQYWSDYREPGGTHSTRHRPLSWIHLIHSSVASARMLCGHRFFFPIGVVFPVLTDLGLYVIVLKFTKKKPHHQLCKWMM